MNDGDEKNMITFDDAIGAVYFSRLTEKGGTQVRVVPLQACAWVELAEPAPPVAAEAPKK